MIRRMYRTLSKAVPAVRRLGPGGEAIGHDAPFRLSPKDGRRVVFGGVALRVFGDPGDAYYAEVARHMQGQGRLCSVLRARCAAARGGAPVVLDVGANIGVSAMAMATALHGPARFLAVEPSPRNLAHLRRNLAANNLEHRVEVIAAAAGAEPGSLAFHESEFGAGSHLVVPGRHLAEGAMPASVEVPMETLDRVVAARGLERLDLIKIDVEGFEPDALAGAAGAIERFRPAVYMEFNSWTLMAFRDMSPRGFLEDLVRRFPHVLAFGPKGELEPVSGQHGMLAFLHRNLVERGCVDDLVLCFDAEWARGVAAGRA